MDNNCFETSIKMASRFATVSEEEILAINEEAVPANTKRATKFGLSLFTGGYDFLSTNL